MYSIIRRDQRVHREGGVKKIFTHAVLLLPSQAKKAKSLVHRATSCEKSAAAAAAAGSVQQLLQYGNEAMMKVRNKNVRANLQTTRTQ